MFKSFLRYFSASIFNWANRHRDNDYSSNEPQSPSLSAIHSYNSMSGTRTPNSIGESINGMNFTVFPATGGKVIQMSHYDDRTSRNNSHLYIVTDSEDLGEELGLIITKEGLSR